MGCERINTTSDTPTNKYTPFGLVRKTGKCWRSNKPVINDIRFTIDFTTDFVYWSCLYRLPVLTSQLMLYILSIDFVYWLLVCLMVGIFPFLLQLLLYKINSILMSDFARIVTFTRSNVISNDFLPFTRTTGWKPWFASVFVFPFPRGRKGLARSTHGPKRTPQKKNATSTPNGGCPNNCAAGVRSTVIPPPAAMPACETLTWTLLQ